ncbi:hypothetical protein APG04_10155 [Pseudomonas aeruginosa]|nr:hypothetical protein APG04_10155 [Pseudomonas aeruginosa]
MTSQKRVPLLRYWRASLSISMVATTPLISSLTSSATTLPTAMPLYSTSVFFAWMPSLLSKRTWISTPAWS